MATSVWAERIMICESESSVPGGYYELTFEYPEENENEAFDQRIDEPAIGTYRERDLKDGYVSGNFAYYLRTTWVENKIFSVEMNIEYKSGLQQVFRFDPEYMTGSLSTESAGFNPQTKREGSHKSKCRYKI